MGQPVSIPEACTEVRSLLRFYNAHKNPSPDAEWILTATGLRQINLLNPKDVFTANMRWIEPKNPKTLTSQELQAQLIEADRVAAASGSTDPYIHVMSGHYPHPLYLHRGNIIDFSPPSTAKNTTAESIPSVLPDSSARRTFSPSADDPYTHTQLVTHQGKVIAFAVTRSGRFYYNILNFATGGAKGFENDADAWGVDMQPVPFSDELRGVGADLVPPYKMAPRDASGNLLPAKKKGLASEWWTSTAVLTDGSKPFEVIEDGTYLYLFRVSQADGFPLYPGNKHQPGVALPVVNGHVLLDRFIFAQTKIIRRFESRFQRSRLLTPADDRDSVGTNDMNGQSFFEPTLRLDFLPCYAIPYFSVIRCPTPINNVYNWHFFLSGPEHATSETASRASGITVISVASSPAGLFDIQGTTRWTCVSTQHSKIYSRAPGRCQATIMGQMICGESYVPLEASTPSSRACLNVAGRAIALKRIGLTPDQWAGPWTWELWIAPSEPTVKGDTWIIENVNPAAASVIMNESGALSLLSTDGSIAAITTDAKLSFGVWNHIALTYKDGKIKVIVNGVESGSASSPAGSFSTLGFGTKANFAAGLHAQVSEMRMWNVCLSDRSIRRAMSCATDSTNDHLVGLWHLDEGTGQLASSVVGDDQALAIIKGPKDSGADMWGWTSASFMAPSGGVRSQMIRLAPGLDIAGGIGIDAALYYEQISESLPGTKQEESHDSGAPSKPLKRAGRVLLSFAARPSSGGVPCLAVIDIALDSEGAIMKLPSLVALPTIGDPSGMTGWRTKRKQLEDAITQNENVMSGQGETTTDTVNRPDRLQQIADNLGALSALDQPRLLQGTSPIYPQVIAYSGSLGMYGAFLDMVQAQLNACPVAIESSVGGVHVYARGQANRLVGFHWDANHVSNWFLASRIFTPKTGASASLYVKRRDARYGNVRIVITAVKVKEDEKPAKTPRVDLIVEGDRDGVKDIETWSGLPESAADAVAILSGEQNSASPYNYATSAKITATTEPNPLRRGSLILSLLVNGIGTLSPGEVLLDAVKGEAGLPRFSLNRSSRALQVDGRPATLPAHIAQSTPDHTSAGTGLAVELWLKPTTALASAPSRLEKYRNPPTIAPGALQLLQYHNDSTSLADGDILRPSSISLTLTPEMGSQSERKVPDYVKQMLKMSYGIEGNFCKYANGGMTYELWITALYGPPENTNLDDSVNWNLVCFGGVRIDGRRLGANVIRRSSKSFTIKLFTTEHQWVPGTVIRTLNYDIPDGLLNRDSWVHFAFVAQESGGFLIYMNGIVISALMLNHRFDKTCGDEGLSLKPFVQTKTRAINPELLPWAKASGTPLEQVARDLGPAGTHEVPGPTNGVVPCIIGRVRVWAEVKTPVEIARGMTMQAGTARNLLLDLDTWGTDHSQFHRPINHSCGYSPLVDRFFNDQSLPGDSNSPVSLLSSYRISGQVNGRDFTIDKDLPYDTYTHLAVSAGLGFALQFDGTANTYIRSSDKIDVTDMTLECTVLLQELRECILMSKGKRDVAQTGSGTAFELKVVNQNNEYRLAFAWRDNSGWHQVTGPTISANTAHRICVTRESTVKPATESGKNPIVGQTVRFSVKTTQNHAQAEIFEISGTPLNADQPMYVGGTPWVTAIKGMISNVRVFTRVLGLDEQLQVSPPDGCILWYQMKEPLAHAGKTIADARGEHHGTLMGNADWVPTPCPDDVPLDIVINGKRATFTASTPGADLTGQALTLGDANLYAEMSELRIWREARTLEEINDNIFTPLANPGEQLLAYYPLSPDAAENGVLQDHSFSGWNLHTDNQAPFPPSVAPIGQDAPHVADPFMPGLTDMERAVDSTTGMAEYGDLETDAQGVLEGTYKRAYSSIEAGSLVLTTGFQIGALDVDFVSQIQTAPALEGFIEGGPPIPGENYFAEAVRHVSPPHASTSFSERDKQVWSYSANGDSGWNSSVAWSSSFGIEAEAGIAIGLGVESETEVLKAKVQQKLSAEIDLSSSHMQRNAESKINVVSTETRAETTGQWRSTEEYDFNNTGLAVVTSTTADVYALRLRLKSSRPLVAYEIRATNLPPDKNIIAFPIRSSYIKQGCLDGVVGTKWDETFPKNDRHSSYYKPEEAYALKLSIERERQRLQAEFESYRESAVGASLLAGATLEGALAQLPSMPSRANRNLCNEYVWSAQAGLYSISSHNIDSRTTELGGTASWGLKGSRGFSADVAIVGVSVSGSLDCTAGMQVHLTSSKTSETESGFEVSSSLPGAMDLRLVDGSGYLAPPGTEAERRKVGAVTDYRFMTFYLESSSDNMRVFFNTVVDPVWLESKDPDAVALKACTNRDTGMAWRVLHRVTYVSRVLGPITSVQEQEAIGTSVKLDKPDIAGNLQLLKALAPYVTTAKTKADLVPVLHEAFAKEYPMLMLSDERMGDVLDLVMFHYDLE